MHQAIHCQMDFTMKGNVHVHIQYCTRTLENGNTLYEEKYDGGNKMRI